MSIRTTFLAQNEFEVARFENTLDNSFTSLRLNKSAPDRFLTLSEPPKTEEHWLIQFRSQAISLISTVLLTCQDSLMACIELDVISWPAILVLLTNQTFMEIRTLVFVMIKNFMVGIEDLMLF